MNLDLITKIYFNQQVLNFLTTPILRGIAIDYWSIIHLTSGYILSKIFKKKQYLLVLIILILYEGFEQILFIQGIAIPETGINVILDILIGMIGYYLGSKTKTKTKMNLKDEIKREVNKGNYDVIYSNELVEAIHKIIDLKIKQLKEKIWNESSFIEHLTIKQQTELLKIIKKEFGKNE